MLRRTLAAAAASLTAIPVFAQDAEIAKIREEIRQMKQAYEQRIEALEKRLADAEAKAVAISPAQPSTGTQAAGGPVPRLGGLGKTRSIRRSR